MPNHLFDIIDTSREPSADAIDDDTIGSIDMYEVMKL